MRARVRGGARRRVYARAPKRGARAPEFKPAVEGKTGPRLFKPGNGELNRASSRARERAQKEEIGRPAWSPSIESYYILYYIVLYYIILYYINISYMDTRLIATSSHMTKVHPNTSARPPSPPPVPARGLTAALVRSRTVSDSDLESESCM